MRVNADNDSTPGTGLGSCWSCCCPSSERTRWRRAGRAGGRDCDETALSGSHEVTARPASAPGGALCAWSWKPGNPRSGLWRYQCPRDMFSANEYIISMSPSAQGRDQLWIPIPSVRSAKTRAAAPAPNASMPSAAHRRVLGPRPTPASADVDITGGFPDPPIAGTPRRSRHRASDGKREALVEGLEEVAGHMDLRANTVVAGQRESRRAEDDASGDHRDGPRTRVRVVDHGDRRRGRTPSP